MGVPLCIHATVRVDEMVIGIESEIPGKELESVFGSARFVTGG